MITLLLTPAGDHTFRDSPVLDHPRLRDRFEILSYGEAFRRRRWQGGSVIFSDFERLPTGVAALAAGLHRRLAAARAKGAGGERTLRLHNHPTSTLRRYGLLRALSAAGINDFTVWRVDEARRPRRYPVFIRSERYHDGPYTDLLHDERALQREARRLVMQGFSPRDLLIVEFCDTADAAGIYRKFTAYIVGDRLNQHNLHFGTRWVVKNPRGGAVIELADEQALIDEEVAFGRADDHVAMLRRAARIARCEFGRVDYGMKDGRIQVWEINTNPTPASLRMLTEGQRAEQVAPLLLGRLREALVALDDDTAHARTIEIEPILDADGTPTARDRTESETAD